MNLQKSKIKLHLGSGVKKIPGYLNLDILFEVKPDINSDLQSLAIKSNSIDEIYCCAAIEHFGRKDWKNVLKQFNRILKKDGRLYISTADFDSCLLEYVESKNINSILGLILGGQRDRYDWHGMIFNQENLTEGLLEAGFKNVQRYDWKEHDVGKYNIDDYSQAYIPHMDKENGRLMMLNLQAQK